MKFIERIAYISFWINIFFVIFVYIGMPILFINIPDFFDAWTENKGRNPINMSFSILSLAVVFHLGYCFWFLFKYDRYSKSIFPLFFLSVIYAPIYYYRVKIKKRPLRNKVNEPQEISKDENAIDEQDFNKLTRESLKGTLNLWASVSEQLKLRDIYNSAEVSKELFDYWTDYNMTDEEVLKEVFNAQEIELLAEFDKEITNVEVKYKREFPEIEEFIETDDWRKVNGLARKVLEKLEQENTVGNNK